MDAPPETCNVNLRHVLHGNQGKLLHHSPVEAVANDGPELVQELACAKGAAAEEGRPCKPGVHEHILDAGAAAHAASMHVPGQTVGTVQILQQHRIRLAAKP